MVKLHHPPPEEKQTFSWPAALFFFFLVGLFLYFSLPSFIEIDEEGNYKLSDERLKDYREKPLRSEYVEVYRLTAGKSGIFPCLQCPGIKSIRLNLNETWKYGISRNGKARYPGSFYTTNHLLYQTIKITDILEAEQLEKQLIIAYPLLPEAQLRMKQEKIFLKRPPGNAKDQ